MSKTMMNGCEAGDSSLVLFGPTNCGNMTYELIASVGSRSYDESSRTAFGTCTGNYNDCQGRYWYPTSVIGAERIVPEPTDPTSAAWSWSLDSWFNNTGNCQCTDPNPAGMTETTVNNPILTAIYYAPCNP